MQHARQILERLLSEIAPDENTMPDEFFRQLSPEEEKEFRDWARAHRDELIQREKAGKLGVLHPVVRSEWRAMKAGESAAS